MDIKLRELSDMSLAYEERVFREVRDQCRMEVKRCHRMKWNIACFKMFIRYKVFVVLETLLFKFFAH